MSKPNRIAVQPQPNPWRVSHGIEIPQDLADRIEAKNKANAEERKRKEGSNL